MSGSGKNVGILSVLNMDDREQAIFMSVLADRRDTSKFDAIKYLLGDKFFLFLDSMAGEGVKVPPRDDLLKYVIYAKVYNYCRERGFSDASVESASKIFNRRKDFVMSVIKKLNRVLGVVDELIDDDLVE